jgi:hypothetical protein
MSVIIPPASFTITEPAAKSQGESLHSKNRSILPDATWQKSRAAEPVRLISAQLRKSVFATAKVLSARGTGYQRIKRRCEDGFCS